MAENKKRARNEGTLYKRTIRGRTVWCAQVSEGIDELGRRKRHTVYGATQAIAREKADALREKLRAGIEIDRGRDTLAGFWGEWLPSREVRATTRQSYEGLWSLHIGPYLGDERLDALQPRTLLAWQSKLRQSGLGNTTRVHAFSLLRTVLKSAVRMNAIAFNPADRMEPPRRGKTRKPIALDAEQTRALIAACSEHPLEAFVLLGVLHGMRYGEIAGLTWGCVDLSAKTLHVHAGLIENRNGERYLAEPKTENAKREVPLSELAVAALRRQRARLPGPPHPKRLVFTLEDGGPIRRSNFHRRDWDRIKKAAGLEALNLRFHDLRHSSASMQLGNGTAVTTVSGVLGHSSPAVTMRLYAHALPSAKRESAELVDRLFG